MSASAFATGSANETDVREEIVAPMLAALGYKRGTANDISREYTLRYPHLYLGRKKNEDPPLRGRADYILSVAGAGRWVLEVKAPSVPINIDAVEQALSYARHPEVSASYSVLVDGKQLQVFHATQNSNQLPLVTLSISEAPTILAAKLEGLLSPAAIRRDCSPPVVDLGLPLSEGLRSSATIVRGEIRHENLNWSSNLQLRPEYQAPLNDMCKRMGGLRVTITGGEMRRDNASRIRARLIWALPHDEALRFVLDKRLMDVDFIALAERISSDPDMPTTFDVVGGLQVAKGEALFDPLSFKTSVAGIDMEMTYSGRGIGHISDFTFSGYFCATYFSSFPAIPELQLEMTTQGTVEVQFDKH